MKRPTPDPILDADLTDAMADAIAPVELSAQQRDRMRERIVQRAVATPPPGMSTLRHTEGVWKTIGPGVHIKVLHVEPAVNSRSFLLRMEPGSQVPVHSHTQDEQCLVVEGEVIIGEHVFRTGDWHVAPAGTTHNEFRTKTGCTVFIRAEIPAHA